MYRLRTHAPQLDYVPLHFGQQHPSDLVVPVTIRAGEQRERIDIALPRGIVISGRVVDEHGEPLQGVVVMASPWRRAEGTPAGITTVSPTGTDDRGVYRLIAVVAPGAAVEGRISVEGVVDADLSGFGISAVPVDLDFSPGVGMNLTAGSRQDGSFRLEGVRGPNRLAVTAMPACEGCYLKQASVESQRVTDSAFDFGLDGRVPERQSRGIRRRCHAERTRDRRGKKGRSRRLRDCVFRRPYLWYPRSAHVTVSRADIDGAFSIRALPPGDYFAVAVTRLPALILSDPLALEQLSAVARRVRLDEWARQTLQLRVLTR